MALLYAGTDRLIKLKLSTAKCDEEIYTSCLLSDPRDTGCTRLSGMMGNISHGSIHLFLERKSFEPEGLFNKRKRPY